MATAQQPETSVEIVVRCTRGNAKVKIGQFHKYCSSLQSVLILTGRRRVWNPLTWALLDNGKITVYGLYSGRYGDAIATDDDLIAALKSLDSDIAGRVIDDIRNARGN